GIVERVNAQTQERTRLQESGERCIPRQAGSASPLTSNTVNDRPGGKIFARAKITDATEPRRVFQFRVARRALGCRAEQPRRRDETARLQSEIARAHSASGIGRALHSTPGW